MRALLATIFLSTLCGKVAAQPPVPEPVPADKYGRGLVAPADLADRQRLSYARKGVTLVGLPKATEAEWDSRSKGWVPPPRSQAACGSCWDFGAMRAAEIAAVKAGKEKADAIDWSEQAVLNCGRNGGCNGDWPETALEQIKNAGVPDEKAVPYVARVQACNANAPRKNTVDDYGYVGPESGVPATQAIKDAIKAYGSVVVAVAADSAFSNWQSGVFPGSGSNQINHAVALVGWVDDAQGGYWILSNSWGPGWCEGGYMRIRYGANRVGYGAMYAVVHDLTPVPPVPPVPPGPTPPVPPTPPTPPTPGKGFTGTISDTQAWKDGVPVGPPVRTINGGGPAAEGVEGDLKSAGVSPEVIGQVIRLLADVKKYARNRTPENKAAVLADITNLLLAIAGFGADPAPADKCCGDTAMSAVFRRETFALRGPPATAA